MITAIVPTYRRPDGLGRAIRSLFAQTGMDAFHITIVDNDPAGSAQDMIDQLKADCPAHISLVAIHEPNPGVANARNAAMASIDTRLVAFLDDDQTAPADWLSQLISAQKAFPAAALFGPVQTALPDGVTEHRHYLEAFFSRLRDGPSGFIDTSYGCGNCLIDREQMPDLDPLFDVVTNETGGEDDMLFAAIRREGGRFAWAADAPVFEHVPSGRASLDYALKRAMAFGQGPCTQARRATPPRYHMLLLWMGVGAIKAVANGASYGVQALLRRPNRAFALDRAVRGLGKVIWWKDFKFYGASSADNA